MSYIQINRRKIGSGYPTYVIAELSANHNQDFNQAVELVKQAKACGADAVKLQTYTADTLTISSDKEYFRLGKGTLWEGKTLHKLYQEAYTPWDWQPKLKELAESLGLDCFSSPFDETAVEFLEKLNMPAYKISSFEIIDMPLVRRVAKTGKPIIFSTGLANHDEIFETISWARNAGANELALLKCSSAYPAPPEEMNLKDIPFFQKKFNLPVGLSDHTFGITVPVAAVSLGACIVEKHFTLSRSVPGPDSAFSLEPDEFKEMVDAIRIAEKALGKEGVINNEQESKSLIFRRSLFIVKNIKKGELITRENVRSIRPSHGLAPKHYDSVLGKHAKKDLEAGTPLEWSFIE